MKPQLIAKRNAEIRRKTEMHQARLAQPEPEIRHFFGSDRASRAREVAIATSQGILGIILVLVGLLFIWPIIGLIPILLRTGPGAAAALFFVLLFLGVFVLIGLAIVRVGIRMLRAAWFQHSVAPGLRMLQKLSFDAVPVTAFTVGAGAVTNHVLISFETDFETAGLLKRLAEDLSHPDALSEIVGGNVDFVPDRRRRVPKDLTDGLSIYLADLQVRHVVASGVVRKRVALECVAEPGSGGRIVVV